MDRRTDLRHPRKVLSQVTEVLKVNLKKVVHERIEDEIIIIDLESGIYYNLVDTAAELWAALVNGATREQLGQAFARRYPGQEKTLEPYLDELLAAEILALESQASPPADFELPEAARPFTAPKLTSHTNMSDLLLLDPIHDVDDDGWPRARV